MKDPLKVKGEMRNRGGAVGVDIMWASPFYETLTYICAFI